ncbi:MAG: hypothetical protein SFY80_12205 [Verrucomicrobiota bacterium]|nr:hypothetical protein [Verrucomicrobiota bacterium]
MDISRMLPDYFKRSALAHRMTQQLLKNPIICGGIFSGMHYLQTSIGSALYPKLLGTYELELTEVFEELFQLKFPRIIVVGAAEGYYVAGCAMRWQSTPIIAYEADSGGREVIERLLKINGCNLSTISIRGFCNASDLAHDLDGGNGGLVIMDVEGAEDTLLPDSLPEGLDACHLLIELHDCMVPGCGDRLVKRLGHTHVIREIHTRSRTLADIQIPRNYLKRILLKPYLLQWVDEGRPGPMRWIYCTPRLAQKQ